MDNIIVNSGLDEGEFKVLWAMFGYGLEPKLTLKELADYFFTTKPTVRFLVEKALLKLRIYYLEDIISEHKMRQ